VANQGVPFPDERKQEFELWPVDVFAGSLICERFIEIETVELADPVLIDRAYAHVADMQALPCFPNRLCRNRLLSSRHLLSEYATSDAISTQMCQISGVWYGYTSTFAPVSD